MRAQEGLTEDEIDKLTLGDTRLRRTECLPEITVNKAGYTFQCGKYTGLYTEQSGFTCASHAVNALVYSTKMESAPRIPITLEDVRRKTKELFVRKTKKPFDCNYTYSITTIMDVLERYGLSCKEVVLDEDAITEPETQISKEVSLAKIQQPLTPKSTEDFKKLRGFIVSKNGHHFALRRNRSLNGKGHCWYNLDSLRAHQTEDCARSPLSPEQAYEFMLGQIEDETQHASVLEVSVKGAFPYIDKHVWKGFF